MPQRPPRGTRGLAAAIGAALALGALTACAPAATPPEPPATERQQTVPLPEIRDALKAADPRVEDVGLAPSRSGAAQVLTVGVVLAGDATVSTENLTAFLVAIRDNLPGGVDQVAFLAREAGGKRPLIDLTPAIDGLPPAATVLWDGSQLTITRDDLDKL
jgi:hypothetical protein